MTAPLPQDIQWALGITFQNYKNQEDRIRRYANQPNAQQEYLNKYNQQLSYFNQAIQIIECHKLIVEPFYPSILQSMEKRRVDPDLYAIDFEYIVNPRKSAGHRGKIQINNDGI